MKIIVEPTSGLANRIRVIVSGISLKEKLKGDLEIIWKNDNGLNCEFTDLFEPIPGILFKKRNFRTDILKNVRGKPRLHSLFSILLGFGFTMYDNQMRDYVWKSGTNLLDLTLIKKPAQNIYINVCNEFFFSQEYLDRFKPKKEIQIEINNLLEKFNEKTIGIHIRRSDNALSIIHSPTEAFIKYMNKAIENDSEVKFFIATDDHQVKLSLRDLYGDKIIYTNYPLNRSSLDGMVGAVVELYALSKTKLIYGSYWSSFSEIASKIGGISLEIAN